MRKLRIVSQSEQGPAQEGPGEAREQGRVEVTGGRRPAEPDAEARAARIARLREEVRAGTYSPDLEAVAQRIIDAGVL